ncbi:hypothetical protein ACFPME_11755 [Rhodanobacter umsongensis]|uniref:Uncharacterized protein n=1 Tax=Rhodanobacter umsongensis TaxID=633153 RepID=A0ABW0JN07_9GAMM
MSSPPPDQPATRSANPARIMLNSPLAAAMRARVYHQRTRQRPRDNKLRILAALGALLVHLLFLFAFVLGPAYELKLPPESPQSFLQVRLIEPPEPPPPPPVRGTPPKERGPRHQGRSTRPTPTRERSAHTQAVVAVQSPPAAAPPVIAKATEPRAPVPKPVAAPPPPVSLPQPSPTPDLQPIPLAVEPPSVTLPTTSLQPPVPPKFQPESVRKPQLEGNQPLLPPASLALPEVSAPSSPPIAVSSMALNAEVPKTASPASVMPARAQPPAAPPVPELQPVPLPAQPSPSVNLQARANMPAPTVPMEKPQVQAPAIEVAEAELEAVPLSAGVPTQTKPAAPTVKIDVADAASRIAVQPSIERPQLSVPPSAPAVPVATAATASKAAPAPSPDTAEQAAAHEITPSPAEVAAGRDVSSAPDAIPQGSDTAKPGEPEGAPVAPENAGSTAATARPTRGKPGDKGVGKQQGVGQPGGNRPGADQGSLAAGAQQGAPGSYVQLKPRGDTEIMNHGTPNIGYRPTRFEQDWAPEGESSIDTALRHAVEKTTVKHTFHLPRGVRVECAVMPLLPMSLLGCRNPDPPPKPVDAKVYERMHLAPARPLAPPAPAVSSAAPAPMVKFDNGAECAAARVAGGPPPPGCEGIVLPVKPAGTPASSSSSSWVPASDQFH